MNLLSNPNIVTEPVDIYEAHRKTHVTSHSLATFRKCPKLYRLRQQGLASEPRSDAFTFGRAFHARVLEPKQFDSRFLVGGPINDKTSKPYGKDTNAFRDWAREQGGRDVLTEDEGFLIDEMTASLLVHPVAAELLTGGREEVTIRTEHNGTPLQARIDYLRPDSIVDVKTCHDIDEFEADAKRYNYLWQLGFYCMLAATTPEVPDTYLVAVEKREPYRCGVWLISHESLRIEMAETRWALGSLVICQHANHWPTGYEKVRTLGATA